MAEIDTAHVQGRLAGATGLPRGHALLAWLVVIISGLYAVSYLWVWLPQFDGANDFFVFWSAGRWVAEHGLTPGLYDVEKFHEFQQALFGSPQLYHPLPYPPTVVPALPLLSALPLGWAFPATMLVTLVLFLWLSAGRRPGRALGLLVSPAALVAWVVGQPAFLTSSLLIGGMRLLDRSPVLAGGLLGLLSVKPQLGLLVPVALIAFRAWRAFAAAAVVTVLLPLPSLLIGGWETWSAWLHLIPLFAAEMGHNIDSATRFMISPAAALIVAGVPLSVARIVQIPISVGIAITAFVACRRYGRSEMAVAMLSVGTLLVTPYAGFYDLLLAGFAAVVLAEAGLRTGFRQLELLTVLLTWVLPLFAVQQLVPAGAIPLALLLLFAILLRRMKEKDVSGQAVPTEPGHPGRTPAAYSA